MNDDLIEAPNRAFGSNGAPAVLRAENRAFLAGWVAGRYRESQRAQR